jgi:enterochelin esterase-like enzyme
MQLMKVPGIQLKKNIIKSEQLKRSVTIDCYYPHDALPSTSISLLLINDGQNLEDLDLMSILEDHYACKGEQLMVVGIYAGEDRKREYGVAGSPDYEGRGDQADKYAAFVMEELLPFIRSYYKVDSFRDKSFAGFSLGGLSALDIVWNHPQEFSRVGVFSGSLWWRSIDQAEKHYDDHLHRIVHNMVRNGQYAPWLKFFFQCGNMDETMDRNNNGIIDSIDDTLDLIKELEKKGYDATNSIHYLEITDGRHDIATWARAMPEFLNWGWGISG